MNENLGFARAGAYFDNEGSPPLCNELKQISGLSVLVDAVSTVEQFCLNIVLARQAIIYLNDRT